MEAKILIIKRFVIELMMEFLFILLPVTIMSQVSAQWRGPERNGCFPETGLLRAWPPSGPDLMWSVSGIGKGFSSPVCDRNVVYVTGMKNDSDYLTAIDRNGIIDRKSTRRTPVT